MRLPWRRKTAEQVHTSILGTSSGLHVAPAWGRVAPLELVKRYGFWVHRCITLNAQAAAAIPIRLFSLTGAGAVTKRHGVLQPVSPRTKAFLRGQLEVAPGSRAKARTQGVTEDMVEVVKHPVLELLADVNPWTDGYAWREALYADLQTFGCAFDHVVRDAQAPTEMWRMLPTMTKVIPDPVNFVSHFESGSGHDAQRFEAEDVLWFRLHDPTNPWGGLGPLEAWLRTIDAAFAIQAFQYELMSRFGSPDYLLTAPNWTPEQRKEVRLSWRKLFGNMGRRREAVATLAGDVTIQKLGQTNRELEFSKSAEGLRDFIGQAFGVPKSMLTTDDVNRANARETKQMHVSGTIWPMTCRVENVLNERLLPMFGDRLVLVHDNPIEEDRTIRVAERASHLASGYSINEVRADDGRDGLEDEIADIPMVGQGLKPITHMDVVKPEPPPMAPGFPPSEEPTEDEEDDTEDVRGFTAMQVVTLVDTMLKVRRDEETKVSITSHKAHWAGLEKQNYAAEPLPEDSPTRLFIADIRRALKRHIGLVQTRLERQPKAATDGEPSQMTAIVVPADAAVLEKDLLELARKHLGTATRRAGEAQMASLPVSIGFDLNNQNVIRFLDDAARRIGKDITATYTNDIRRVLLDGFKRGAPLREMSGELQKLGEHFSEWKADQVARTESGFAQAKGQVEAWKQSGVVTGKYWRMAPEACEWCVAVSEDMGDGEDMGKSQVFNLDDPLYAPDSDKVLTRPKADGTGERQLAMNYGDAMNAGKIHPNCRCGWAGIISEV